MKKHERKQSAYLAIELWGRQLGSFPYYIKNQQEKAEDMNAPFDAIYEREGKWVCVTDLAADHPFCKDYEEYKSERQ